MRKSGFSLETVSNHGISGPKGRVLFVERIEKTEVEDNVANTILFLLTSVAQLSDTLQPLSTRPHILRVPVLACREYCGTDSDLDNHNHRICEKSCHRQYCLLSGPRCTRACFLVYREAQGRPDRIVPPQDEELSVHPRVCRRVRLHMPRKPHQHQDDMLPPRGDLVMWTCP